MLRVRKFWTVLVGAWAGAVAAHVLLEWILGQGGAWVAVVILASAFLGGLGGVAEAKDLEPLDPVEHRDKLLGWGTLLGGVGAVACLFLPMPWGVIAAAGVVAATVLVLARVPKPASGHDSSRTPS
jgi:hypothetical protein